MGWAEVWLPHRTDALSTPPFPPIFCASASTQLFKMTSIRTVSRLFSFLLSTDKYIVFLARI